MVNIRFLLFVFLFICSSALAILINKYVLWSLKFTYPTVFQSMQMCAVVFIMFSLRTLGIINIRYIKIELLAWLPAVLCFAVSIYFGSKALAVLPVSIFTFFQQVLTHSALIGMRWFDGDRNLGVIAVISWVACWCCIATLLVYSVSIYSCRWLLIHCVANALYSCYARFNKVEISELDKMNTNALGSVVVLTIFGMETGETWLIFQFEHISKLYFHFACVASGVLGAVSILTYTEICGYVTAHGARLYYTYAMVCASVLSYLLYQRFIFSLRHVWNLIGLFMLTMLCTLCYGDSAFIVDTPKDEKDSKVAHI